MSSTVVKRLAARPLALAVCMLVAAAGAAGSSAAARAGRDVADSARASATLTVRSTRFGAVLFDGRGRALYSFTRDRGGRSQCYGPCAKAWPVYFAKGRSLAGKGVRQALIGATRRRDGQRQITYNGRPLYYYVGDKKPGQILCQNVAEFGGTWLVVRPNGQPIR